MGNVQLAYLIFGTARAMRRAASDLRESRDAAKLGKFLRSPKALDILDTDDLDLLADLCTGLLNRKKGDRGPAANNRAISAAERAARLWATENNISLAAAAEVVAGEHGVDSETLINKLRRGKAQPKKWVRPP